MLLDYELAISCALAALAILHLIDLRRKGLKVRQQQRSNENAVGASRDPTITNQAGAPSSQGPGNDSLGHWYHQLIVVLLILALIWFGGRIWVEAWR